MRSIDLHYPFPRGEETPLVDRQDLQAFATSALLVLWRGLTG
jgi:hypothetical protein